MPIASTALLAATLSLFLALLGFVVVKYVRYQSRERDADSDDDNDNDAASEVVGVDSNGEKIALINQEHRRMQRAESSADGSLFQRLIALLSLPGAVAETKLMPKRYRRRNRRKPASRKFHKPYFYPLLQETAQWWEVQCELQTIKVDSTAAVMPSIAKRVGVAPDAPYRPVDSDLLYAVDAAVLAN